ncbi:four-carbon acid sugar kinase family protein [Aridibaculum aurantiacum]|uniref:four-carbon acid sugar kinase family protein n=1 Tax=Aridibaculum aurantiacum TaxID=2810307 RepID=UPI001A96A00E|nr:four-carbon acid sugar kinase family protein [Aridibaculum aurantiacum]
MIVVIADDLTGAAELGGLGLKYGLEVEIVTEVDKNTDADLLIISADTRSVSEEEATAKIKEITTRVLALQPELVFKKIDSVLRGHVLAEAKAQMEVMGLDKALIVSANPSLGRTIKNGTYYFNGAPISESSFSNDPEFPVTTSKVTEMLRVKSEVVRVINANDPLPAVEIVVGEVEDNSDLDKWATRVDGQRMLVGAAGFFNAILATRFEKVEEVEKPLVLEEPMLFVCGTTFYKSRKVIREVRDKGGPVSYMPAEIINNDATAEGYTNWSKSIATHLLESQKAIVAIDEASTKLASAGELREKTAGVVQQVLEQVAVKELVVEGGSTAASIIGKQQFKKLIPVQELSPGVIRMKVEGQDLFMTIKPGSYDWSPGLWMF